MEATENEVTRNVEKGKLKYKFALLTQDDQLLNESKQDEILGRQQVRLGNTKKVLRTLLSEL